jgi:hypothetical protein
MTDPASEQDVSDSFTHECAAGGKAVDDFGYLPSGVKAATLALTSRSASATPERQKAATR